jgi:hypothetical protein
MDTLFSNNKCSKKNNITSSWFHILKDIIDKKKIKEQYKIANLKSINKMLID